MRWSSGWVALFVGLLCVSTAGPFLVMAHTHAIAAVFWRMALAAPLFLAWSAARNKLWIPPEHRARLVVGALLLAAHFVLWVRAFDLTDFASNLVLLVAQPIIAAAVAVASGERRGRDLAPSVLLAAVGLTVIAGGDFALGPRALLGDAFSVIAGGAITAAYVVTRRARASVYLPTFMGTTFAVGATAVGLFALIIRAPLLPQPPRTWEWLIALVLVTTMAGHGLMNLAARSVSLFALNLVIVLEPAIAIALGALMFGTHVRATTMVGAAVLFAAVVLGLRAERLQLRAIDSQASRDGAA